MSQPLPSDTVLFQQLVPMASLRCVVFAGLPGIGKTVLTQQVALLAHATGRKVHLMQWDLVRAAFETELARVRYPDIGGATHPVVRMAANAWARPGLSSWIESTGDDNALLIVEAPLIGGRMIDLARPFDDGAESLLASPQTVFVLPVPSRRVKDALRQKRLDAPLLNPLDGKKHHASVKVLDALVAEVGRAGVNLGMPAPDGYDPEVYSAVYGGAMSQRRVEKLAIDEIFDLPGTIETIGEQVVPRQTEIAQAYEIAELRSATILNDHDAQWYRSNI